MNKRKLIYFLIVFVLIIGCYALNLSYSLFTQNITTKNNVVDTTVPILNASLETNLFTIPANSGEVIKLNIINSGTANIQYGISVFAIPEGLTAYLVEKMDNEIVGTLETSKNKEILIYVKNDNSEDTNISFNLESKYETIKFDKETFINNSNIDCTNKIRLLNESILVRANDITITDENKTIYDESFDSNNITDVSGENERLLIKAEDDYGTSYVFRGAIKDNYINFAGFTWRIVRINGNGSVRLILDGTLNKICAEKNEDDTCKTYAGTTSEYNSGGNNTYIGYMHGLSLNDTINVNQNRCLKLSETSEVIDDITNYETKEECEANGGKWTTNSYEATHANVKDSTIKTNVDTFYKTYIENPEKNIHYEKYLADTLFCNDKSLAKDEIGESNTILGFGIQQTYYAAAERLFYSLGTTVITTASPSLKCANGATNNYSRLTSNLETTLTLSNGTSINNDLKYPIALLSADELVLAGAWSSTNNDTYYLSDSYDEGLIHEFWWSNTPFSVDSSNVYISGSNAADFSLLYSNTNGLTSENNGVRPVINLKSNLLLESGNGTKNEPYILK